MLREDTYSEYTIGMIAVPFALGLFILIGFEDASYLQYVSETSKCISLIIIWRGFE
jgi:hypothetical protein